MLASYFRKNFLGKRRKRQITADFAYKADLYISVNWRKIQIESNLNNKKYFTERMTRRQTL
ncbi:hypothetical protein AV540_12210 [Brevibacillus parabrevis]|nr:hypothetical protein AV540_12210 [Brevibacillus parabrevis]